MTGLVCPSVALEIDAVAALAMAAPIADPVIDQAASNVLQAVHAFEEMNEPDLEEFVLRVVAVHATSARLDRLIQDGSAPEPLPPAEIMIQEGGEIA